MVWSWNIPSSVTLPEVGGGEEVLLVVLPMVFRSMTSSFRPWCEHELGWLTVIFEVSGADFKPLKPSGIDDRSMEVRIK